MIEVERLCKSYGAKRAVADVSFTAPAGQVTAFVGPNGAGKSTVMRMVAGLTIPDSGRVRVAGAPFTRAASPATTMGVFLTAEWLPAGATARGVLQYACDSQGFPRARVADALELVGLAQVPAQRIGTFSLGMRQRLGIAVATLGRPRILMLDEPVNGLDPDGIHWFRMFVQAAARDGAAVLLSSHHMTELALIADRVVILHEGRVLRDGSLGEVVADERLAVYATSPDPGLVRQALLDAGHETAPYRDGFLVRGVEPLEVGRIAFAVGAGLTHLERVSRSLEESYFELLSSTERGM